MHVNDHVSEGVDCTWSEQEIDQGRDVWGSGTNEGHGEWQDDPNENPYQVSGAR